MFTLEMPYPPSFNHAYTMWQGRRILSAENRQYRQHIRQQVRQAGARTLLGPLAVRLELYPPDLRRRDCDNAEKMILDALQQAGLFVDDSQIVWLLTVKGPIVTNGRVRFIGSVATEETLPSSSLLTEVAA
jgi:crossover junction endodeoxyribonuclease RusA